MAFDRSKFQAARKADLKKQQEEAVKPNMPNNTRPGYVNLKKGEKNVVRIFPPHPDTFSYIYQKAVNWLPFEVEDDGKREIKRRPVFNPMAHSEHRSVDPVGFYRELAKKTIENEGGSAKEIKDRISSLFHYKNGIPTTYKWVCYAEVENSGGKEFGRLELGTSVKEQMDKLAFSEENADDAMQCEPFTDPDDGFPIQIDYKDPKDVKPQEVYSVSFMTKNYIPVAAPLTDDQLEKFAEMDTLESMFHNTFTKKDMDKIIEGLQVFDQQNNLGIIGTDEFLDYFQEVYELFPEPKTESEKDYEKNGVPDLPMGNPKEEPKKEEEEDDLPWSNDGKDKEPKKEEAPKPSPSTSGNAGDMKAKLEKLKAMKAKLKK